MIVKNGILGIKLSLIVCCYFAGLILISSLKIKPPVLVSVLVELITIPVMLVGLTLLVYNFYKIYKGGWVIQSDAFFTVLIVSITILMVTVATVYNI